MASVLNEGAEGNCRSFETNDLETCGASGSEGVSSFEVIRSNGFTQYYLDCCTQSRHNLHLVNLNSW